MRLPKMRTATKIVFILFLIVSTMLYCVVNHQHDKYSQEANSGEPHSDDKHVKDKLKPDADCLDGKCKDDVKKQQAKQVSKMNQVMQDERLTEQQKMRVVDQLRAEMSHFADLPEYSELKKQWDEDKREKQQEDARQKKQDATKKEPSGKDKESEANETGGKTKNAAAETAEQPKAPTETIHLAVVACGDRMEETLIMLKSATLFTKAPMKFHIFTDEDLKPEFTKQLNGWPDFVKEKFTFQLYDISFPGVSRPDLWIKFFKPCACQRIFLPDILTDVDKLLYVDTDILFFIPLDDIWHHFSKFNSTHISALAPEHEQPWMGWYNRFARHPYYGPLGVNSGVMLMKLQNMRELKWVPKMDDYFKTYRLNMTWGDQDLINVFFHYFPGVNSGVMLMDLAKMKASNWTHYMEQYYNKYRYRTTWGDQDLINIFFHFFPDKLYIYPCEWNFRADHCMYGSVCKTAEETGVLVVHGSRGVYHNEKQPLFKAIYRTVKEFPWGGDLDTSLVQILEHKFKDKEISDTYCGKASHLFTSGLKRVVDKKKKDSKR